MYNYPGLKSIFFEIEILRLSQKNKIRQLIDDFHERQLPEHVVRNKELPELKGKAGVIMGMRRAGKTWFCYQKMAELISKGKKKEEILYINFEDDRLIEFNVDHFQYILDVYFEKFPDNRDTRCYFFFDEIQRIYHWEIFIRRLLDTKNSLYDYIDHLADVFLIYRIPIHSRSEKSRMINPPKIYIIDNGLLNAMTFRNSIDSCFLLENMSFMHLRRQGYEIEYVNTKDGYETDFFVRNRNTGDVNLIQVCWDISESKTFERELRGLQSAMDQLSIPSGTIVTWDDEDTLDNSIEIVPFWKWIIQHND